MDLPNSWYKHIEQKQLKCLKRASFGKSEMKFVQHESTSLPVTDRILDPLLGCAANCTQNLVANEQKT